MCYSFYLLWESLKMCIHWSNNKDTDRYEYNTIYDNRFNKINYINENEVKKQESNRVDYKTIDVYNDILDIDISFDDEVLQDNIVSDNNSESSEEWIKIDNII